MKSNTLLKIAFIGSLISLIILYFISQYITVDEASIEKITKGSVGEVVRVSGVVKSINALESVTFLTIEKPEEVKVIVFKNLGVKQGDYVEVIGEIEEYEGEREVIGNAVRIIS